MNIPKGWKLVPEEPTSHMKAAGEEWAEKGFNWPAAIYRAMTRAAPTPPEQESEPVAWMYESQRHRCVSMCRDDNKGGDEIETPLYLHPANDKLRKAAEEFIDYFASNEERSIEEVFEFIGRHEENLRAALEGK